ncbi:hypothetical protein [Planctomycetes bacterium K23_9]|uniref:Uncharacterized protein n=1 Tax=Stieleria marina TaxID=1930275 RepID=A0A517NY69_9BACT|nr:hypothetical protein K239x_40680 [Planctomycetes bacterium K23_9]
MSDSENQQSSGFQSSGSGRGKKPFGRRSAGGIAIVVLLAAYGFAQPKLNERFGWNLPGLKQDRGGQVVVEKSDHRNASDKSSENTKSTDLKYQPKSSQSTSGSSSVDKQSGNSASSRPGDSAKASGPLASRMSPKKSSADTSKNNSTRGSPPAKQSAKPSNTPSADNDLLYGLLRDTGNKRYVSPSGLMYTPGSAEGHRLEHLRRHIVDNKSRPVHGVFDGEMEDALKVIDMAYERAKKNQKTTKSVDKGMTVYTVDMGKRIGFVGGQKGQRNRNQMARRVKLVLSGNRVITAFPL